MVRNSGRQLPSSNKIIWLDARIIFKLNRLQSVFMFTLIVIIKRNLPKKLNNQLVTQQSTSQKLRHHTIIFQNKNWI